MAGGYLGQRLIVRRECKSLPSTSLQMRMDHLEPLASTAPWPRIFFVFLEHGAEEGCVSTRVWDGWLGDRVCSP